MLTPEQIKCAIGMIGRASCKGSEAPEVSATLDALVALYNELTAPPPADEEKDEDGDDS